MAYTDTNITIDATKTVRFNMGGKIYITGAFDITNGSIVAVKTKTTGDKVANFYALYRNQYIALNSQSAPSILPGTTYELYENYPFYRPDNTPGSHSSNSFHYMATYTTPPSKPILEYNVADNTVKVDWKLEYYGGNWTKIYINLYRAEDLSSIYKSIVVYAGDVGYNTYYGTAYFTNVESGDYVIKSQSIYVVNDVEIPCCVDEDNLPRDADASTDVSYTFITDVFKVGSGFQWTYAYIDNDDNVILGETKEMVQGQKYLYVAAIEWNELCDYVKQKWSNGYYAEWTIGDNPYGYVTTTTMKEIAEDAKVVSGEDMSARKFNLVRECIGAYPTTGGTGLSNYSSGDDIKIEYFNILKDKANQMN